MMSIPVDQPKNRVGTKNNPYVTMYIQNYWKNDHHYLQPFKNRIGVLNKKFSLYGLIIIMTTYLVLTHFSWSELFSIILTKSTEMEQDNM